MKKLFILGTVVVSTFSYSQVGIGTGTPHASLEIVASGNNNNADGLLIPRLTRGQLTDKGDSLYNEDQIGTMVYISDVTDGDAVLSRINITTTGFYFFDGTFWQKVNNQSNTYTGSSSITLNGNSFERNALTGDVVANANSNATTISNGAVTTAKLADNSVNSAKIINASITNDDLALNSVESDNIVNGTIVGADLAANSITNDKIVNGTIIADDLASNSVTNAKIANNAVNISKLPTGATGSTFLRGDGAWATPANTNTVSGTLFNAPGGAPGIGITSAYQSISGTSMSVTIPAGNTRVVIISYTLGIDLTSGPEGFGASYYTGRIYHNGNATMDMMTMQEPPNNGQATGSGLTYSITAFRMLTAGTHTFDFRIARTQGNGVPANAVMQAQVLTSSGYGVMFHP